VCYGRHCLGCDKLNGTFLEPVVSLHIYAIISTSARTRLTKRSFQEVQNKSTITTSLYLLPNLVIGAVINLTVGLLVDRVSARWLCAIATFLAAIAPLMMALLDPNWSYWYLEFWAQALTPFSGDVLFTVGLIVVSDSFPEKTQALAGAVFNTAAQFGISLGIGLCQVVSLGVMSKNGNTEPKGSNNEAFDDVDQGVLLQGYRAAFWTMFALLTVTTVLAVVGLRKAGKVGLKRE
jgi:nitrate/nitrite transporter NarK